jgi:hypothetical protein
MSGTTTSARHGRVFRTSGALLAGALAGSVLMLASPASAAPHQPTGVAAPATVSASAVVTRSTTVYFLAISPVVGRHYTSVLAAFVATIPAGATNMTVRVDGWVQRTASTANDLSLSQARAVNTSRVLRSLHLGGSYVITGKRIAGNTAAARRATVTVTYRPTRRAQTITFAQPNDMDFAPQAQPVGGKVAAAPLVNTQALVVSASSGLPVTVTSNTPLICTVTFASAAWVVEILDYGTCSLTATQAGNATYAPAKSVTRTFQSLNNNA